VVNSTSTTGHTTGFRSLTLADHATIGGTGRWDVRPITAGQGLVDLAGKTLTKTGSNLIAFVNGTITDGTVNVSEGTLALTRNTWATGTVNVTSGAILQFENNTPDQFSYGMGHVGQ
jgi:fibronectin-binding autotransporter adhesin